MTSVIKTPSENIIKIAKRESEKSKAKFCHGAVIFRGSKRIVSKGYNVHKTDPLFGSGDYKMLHSEGAAIKDAVRRRICLKGASIYVYRRYGMYSKPCPCCSKLIQKYGIKEVMYSDILV
jgi:deoxycytidylate deaminase